MRGRLRAIASCDRAADAIAGALETPKLLMLSGIGPAADLAALGIPVLGDRAGGGANLQDHLEVYLQFACTRPPDVLSPKTSCGGVCSRS